ncbi:motility associated factor glycosyltransferase family protein [Gracilibacillus marinus]|uniref:Motility associated factor glycosyltransferase family protein n=1 Tax=Gracilibacillus marinus TaxID=630535 RepID=A0ABV8VRE5_9BACI
MILVDNINFLRGKYQHIRDYYKNENEKKTDFALVELTKSGLHNIIVNKNDKQMSVHSKYDPEKEAKAIANKYMDELEDYDHIFFYGAGMGYHIREIMSLAPNKEFTVYEPSSDIFYQLISTVNVKEQWPVKKLKNLFVEFEKPNLLQSLQIFSNQLNGKVLLIELPSYKRIFPEKYELFGQAFKEIVRTKKQSLHTNMAYEKRWIINSLLNSQYVVKTPNILHDIPKEHFKDKPAVIVAAGPSLEQDIEHIRYIKENNLAYVFSIGSGVNALLNHNIYPDATLSYDPSHKNILVFEKIINNEIKDIPLIFGSSIAFDVLQKYPGDKMYHMITTQDTFSDYYLKHKNSDKINKISDAPSIAVLAIEMLTKLGSNPIILTGQNLSYLDGKQYAESISYQHVNNELTDGELQKHNEFKVKDVYGNIIQSSQSFISMKKQIENYLANLSDAPVIINTTKGGADISGAPFKDIETVMKEELNQHIETNNLLNLQDNRYDSDYIDNKIHELKDELTELETIFNLVLKQIRKLDNFAQVKDESRLTRAFVEFDQTMEQLKKNKIFKIFIQPMSRNRWDILVKSIQEVRFNQDLIIKAKKIVEVVANYMYYCKKDIEMIAPMFNNMTDLLLRYFSEEIGEQIDEQ